jgi:hypothetical protein
MAIPILALLSLAAEAAMSANQDTHKKQYENQTLKQGAQNTDIENLNDMQKQQAQKQSALSRALKPNAFNPVAQEAIPYNTKPIPQPDQSVYNIGTGVLKGLNAGGFGNLTWPVGAGKQTGTGTFDQSQIG